MPASGWMAPEMILTSVLLPAPLSPRRQTTSPLPTVKVPSSRAESAPYDFFAPVIEKTGVQAGM